MGFSVFAVSWSFEFPFRTNDLICTSLPDISIPPLSIMQTEHPQRKILGWLFCEKLARLKTTNAVMQWLILALFKRTSDIPPQK